MPYGHAILPRTLIESVDVGAVAFLVRLQVHHDVVVRRNGTLGSQELGIALAGLVHPYALVALGQFQGPKQQGGVKEQLGRLGTVLIALSALLFTPPLLFRFTTAFILGLTRFVRPLHSLLLGLLRFLFPLVNGSLLALYYWGSHLFGLSLGYVVLFHNLFCYMCQIGSWIVIL